MTDIKELVEVLNKELEDYGNEIRQIIENAEGEQTVMVVAKCYTARDKARKSILRTLGENGCMIEVCNTHIAEDGVEWKTYRFIPLSQALKEAEGK
jgi:hypothetical protein